MKNLIRKILREQEEEDFSPVIPKWSKEKINERIFKYLDMKSLKIKNPHYFEGMIFAQSDRDFYGLLGFKTKRKFLSVDVELIEEIFDKFSIYNIDHPKILSIIGEWVNDRYNLKPESIHVVLSLPDQNLEVDNSTVVTD